MNNNVADREIHLLDMIWAVCLKWRQIVLCALVLAVLAGGYSYYRSGQAIERAKNISVVTSDGMNLDEKTLRNAELYMFFEKQYDDFLHYSMSSPIMKLDPSAVWEGATSYYVGQMSADVQEMKKDVIISAYRTRFEGQEFADAVAEVVGCGEDEKAYVAELVQCEDAFGNTSITERDAKAVSALDDGVLTVRIFAGSKEQCEGLMKLAEETVANAQKDVSKTIGAHKLTAIGGSVNLVSDSRLMEYQRDKNNKVSMLEQNYRGLGDRLGDQELTYVAKKKQEEQAGEVAESASETMINQTPTVSKKLVVVGFVLGAILIVCLQVVLYIFDRRLRLEDYFENNYSIPLLGNVITDKDGKKKWFFFIDSIFTSLRHHDKHYFAESEAINMVAAGIRIAAKRLDTKRVYVTGSSMGASEKAVLAKMQALMKESGIELICGNSILYDAESLEGVAEVGFVVFLEEAGSALHKEIKEEIEICNRQGIEVIGAVVVA